MTQCRVVHDKNNPYLTINTGITRDSRLSWKAKGIWLYAFSQADDWQFYVKDLQNQSTEGRDAVRGGLRELENAGYLYRKAKKQENTGLLAGHEWYFFETPKNDSEIKEMIPKDWKSVGRISCPTDNRPLLSTKREEVIKEQQPAAVLPQFLTQIDGLSESAAWKLLDKYTETELLAAAERLAGEEDVQNAFGWLSACIDESWESKPSKEDRTEANKRVIADVFAGIDGKPFGLYTAFVGPTYVEFVYGSQVKRFDVKNLKFEWDVRQFIDRARGG